jgi:hypothetical protein
MDDFGKHKSPIIPINSKGSQKASGEHENTHDEKEDDPVEITFNIRGEYARLRLEAELLGLTQSPFFPQTVEEYTRLKLYMSEERAESIYWKVNRMEGEARALKNAHWKLIPAVNRYGSVEVINIPIYHENPHEREKMVEG